MMNILNKKWVIIIFSSIVQLAPITNYCQIYNEESSGYIQLPTLSPSPNPAALMKFVDQPVDYMTGVPQISIPIFTIKSGNIVLPISLDYYAGGIKVSQESSNVGLGWSLNAGGMVSREIRGIIDDFDYQPYGGVMYSSIKLEDYIDSAIANPAEAAYYELLGVLDSEADRFNYKIGGLAGTFLFNQFDSKFYELEDSNNKIEYFVEDGVRKRIYRWKLTDPNGISYFFGGNTPDFQFSDFSETNLRELKGSHSVNPNTNFSTIGFSTWYVNKIVDRTGQEINFEYGTHEIEYYQKAPKTTAGTGNEVVLNIYSEITVKEKYLTKIHFQNGFVQFDYSNNREDLMGGNRLTGIKIYSTLNNVNKLIKQIKLNNDQYFNSTQSNGAPHPDSDLNEKRLKLNSLEFRGSKSSDAPEVYEFKYDDNLLPPKFSNAIDYWGGYNGKNDNNGTIPGFVFYFVSEDSFINGGSGFVERHVDSEFSAAATLRKIIYPTGGYAIYDYEPNSASDLITFQGKFTQEEKLYYRNVKNPYSTTEHNFTSLSSGEGWINCEKVDSGSPFIVYFDCLFPTDKPLQSNFTYEYNYSCPENSYQTETDQAPNGGMPLCNFRPPVFTDLNNQSLPNWMFIDPGNYKVRVKFNGSIEILDPGPEMASFDLKLKVKQDETPDIRVVGGLRIKKIETFDENNKKVSSREFQYEFIDDGNKLSSGKTLLPLFGTYESFLAKRIINFSNPFTTFFYLSDTNIHPLANGQVSYSKVLEKFTDVYNPGNSFEKVHFFDNTSYLYISNPMEFQAVRAVNDMEAFWVNKNNKNIYNGADENELLTETNDYTEFPDYNVIFSGFRLNPMNFTLLNGGTISNYMNFTYYTTTGHRNLEKSEQIQKFDNSLLKTEKAYEYESMNPLFPSSKKTTNSLGESLNTKYKYPQDVTGEPHIQEMVNTNRISEPVKTETFVGNLKTSEQHIKYGKDSHNLILPSEVFTKKGSGNIDINSSADRKITYDKYDEYGNLLQYTMENGTPVSIIWGYNGQYPIAKVEGLEYSSVLTEANTLIGMSNNGSLSASSFETLRKKEGALVTSYIYDPLVGVTTIIQPDGQKATYEYDNAGRLKLIKNQDGNVLKEIKYNYYNQQP